MKGGLIALSKKIIVITGPTGVGKTAVSLEIAKYLKSEIINCDASQFYRYLDIGTAKLKIEDQCNIPHHMIGFLNPLQPYSIKEFQQDARKLIEQIDIPILVGGSGLYINAVIYNYLLEASAHLHEDDETQTNQELYAQLQEMDKDLAEKTHPNNRRRVIRYLQIAREKISYQKDPKLLYDVLFICLERNREELYERINMRCEQMFHDGWIRECIEIQDMGYNLSAIKEIGYHEIGLYLDNKSSLQDTIFLIQQKTRHYAKRQLTWFRNKMDCQFIDISTTPLLNILSLVDDFLSTN